jgi:hypothetical protein
VKKLVEAYQTEETAKFMLERTRAASFPPGRGGPDMGILLRA